jgi:hypothetical protein
LQLSEKYLQQNSALEEWTDYRVACFTDVDLNGLSERVIIEAHSDGRLTLNVYNTDLQHNNTSTRVDYVMSENNSNVDNGTPLFVYLDGNGSEITTLSARPAATRNIRMQVEVETDDYHFEDDRLIHLRNRN